MEDLKSKLEFLAKDEEEAIAGYDKVLAELDENDPIAVQLKKIRDEEQAHLDFLLKAKENPNAKYVDPSDENEDEVKKASELFKMNLKGE